MKLSSKRGSKNKILRGLSATVCTGTNNKFEYRKPTKQAKPFNKGKREVCKVLTQEEINKLYN